MPVKTDLTKEVKCSCGKNTVVDVKPATAYCELTRFVCSCGHIYHVVDYMNGITIYYTPSAKVDEEIMKEIEASRVKCSYPMSLFYTYEDEVPDGTKVSTPEDCEKCDGFENDACEGSRHCLIIDSKIKEAWKNKQTEK